jgi:outer membrane immunogenic protein
MRTLFLIPVLAAGVSAPAMAQTNSGTNAENFSGFRIEALGGYDNTSADNDGDFSPGTQDRFDDGSGEGLEGFLYGIGAGYDMPVSDTIVFGIEGEITDSTAGETENDTLGAGSRLSFEAERDL